MTRSERDQIEKALRRLMETAGDNCSLCGREFTDGDVTAGGTDASGTVHLVSTCCASKLSDVVIVGRYLSHGQTSPSDVLRRAGLANAESKLRLSLNPDTPWQMDDREWFDRHPRRTHRARPAHPGEQQSLMSTPTKTPEGHELWVLIRQVEPGRRVRIPFFRDPVTELPDIDAVVAALFDLARSGQPGQVISARDIAASVQLTNPNSRLE